MTILMSTAVNTASKRGELLSRVADKKSEMPIGVAEVHEQPRACWVRQASAG